jgi:hypothetical protein
MELSSGETIVDEAKFLETHTLRVSIGGKINEPFQDRLDKHELNLKNNKYESENTKSDSNTSPSN